MTGCGELCVCVGGECLKPMSCVEIWATPGPSLLLDMDYSTQGGVERYVCMYGWMDGLDGWMDGWMDG